MGQNASPREEGKERARDDIDSMGRENLKGKATYINPQVIFFRFTMVSY